MALTTHSSPPTTLTAGDAYQWRESPTDGGDVTEHSFQFRSIDDSDVNFTVTGTDEGTTFLFTMDGTETTSLDGGKFTVVELITRGADGRKSEYHPDLIMGDNPANDPTKNFFHRMVALLEQHIEGRLPEGLERTEIGGVPIEKIPLTDASDLMLKYQRLGDAKEQKKQSALNPRKKSGRLVKIHF